MNIEELMEQWKRIHESKPLLIYPKVELTVYSEHNYGVSKTTIRMETFIPSKEGDRLMYFRDSYESNYRDSIWEELSLFRIRFEEACEFTMKKGKFHNKTTIEK